MKKLLKGVVCAAVAMIAVSASAQVVEKKWAPTVPNNDSYGNYVVEACIAPGETAWFSLYSYNYDDTIQGVCGTQGDIFLPTGLDMTPGVDYVYDEETDEEIEVPNDSLFNYKRGARMVRNDHIFEGKLRKDLDEDYDYSAEPEGEYHDPYGLYGKRHFRYLVYSGKNTVFNRQDGVLFQFEVKAGDDFKGGIAYVARNSQTKKFTANAEFPAGLDGVRAPVMQTMLYAPTSLADVLSKGADGETFYIGDVLAVVEGSEVAGCVYVTDGNGNWMKISTDDYSAIASMKAFAARSVKASLSGIALNPVLTLAKAPTASTNEVAYEIEEVDMAHHFNIKPNQVVKVSGYYTEEDGVGVLRAYSGEGGGMGQSLTIDMSQLGTDVDWQVGAYYTLPASAVELKEAWANNVSLDDDNASQNYIIYPLQAPAISTGVNNLKVVDGKVSVNGNTITVEGAKNVAIFNAAGARVSNAAASQVAPGVYVVLADGVASKVVVK